MSQVAWAPKIGSETREAIASIEEPIPNPYDGVEEEDGGGNEQDEDDTELAYARRQARPPKPATREKINGAQGGSAMCTTSKRCRRMCRRMISCLRPIFTYQRVTSFSPRTEVQYRLKGHSMRLLRAKLRED